MVQLATDMTQPVTLPDNPRVAIHASPHESAQQALGALADVIPHAVPMDEADVVIALGGDGTMLEVLHTTMGTGVPVFGMNRGSVGFLLNDFNPDDLLNRLKNAQQICLHPLSMVAKTELGAIETAYAINEVSVLRETRQAAKIKIMVDGVTRLEELICDGALVATPAGSTAYNLSAHGPILPLGAQLMAVTPISPFRPRRWRGALLPHTTRITFEVLEADKRPVSAVADYTEIRDIVSVEITEDRSIDLNLLFDPDQNLGERIIKEQFQPL
ncbi:MAG: NAD kinase [Pseudomonadota bacterium]